MDRDSEGKYPISTEMTWDEPKIVAEIGCNHNGCFNTAVEMIKIAAQCGVNYVKFQKRNPEAVPNFYQLYDNPNSFGLTYGDHRKALEFDISQHIELQLYCEQHKVGYGCSVWDMDSAQQIINTDPSYVKIPSAHNNNKPLLQYVLESRARQIHISLGMIYNRERQWIIETSKFFTNVVLYHTTSAYPCPIDRLNLLEIKAPWITGFSGHHTGIAPDLAAYMLGARWFERHFTLDRSMKGTDHAASLEPDGLRRLVRDLKNLPKALTYKKTDIVDIEWPNRKKLKWNP